MAVAVDASNSAIFSSTGTGSISLTTSHNGRMVIAVCWDRISAASLSSVTVTSGPSTPTFTERAKADAPTEASRAENVDIWYADTTATGSYTVQVSFTGAPPDDAVLLLMQFYSTTGGTLAWDTNGSLPALFDTGSGTLDGSISTNSSNPFILGVSGNSGGSLITAWTPSGSTLINSGTNGGGVDFQNAEAVYWTPGAAISSQTYGSTTSAITGVVVIDALNDGSAAPAYAPPNFRGSFVPHIRASFH